MKMVECTKCGEPKRESEFYRAKKNVCKECCKAVGRARWAERREAKKKEGWNKLRGFILGNYEEANVEINGVQVVSNGEFVGKKGRMLFCEMMLKHRVWMKENHLGEPDMVPE